MGAREKKTIPFCRTSLKLFYKQILAIPPHLSTRLLISLGKTLNTN